MGNKYWIAYKVPGKDEWQYISIQPHGNKDETLAYFKQKHGDKVTDCKIKPEPSFKSFEKWTFDSVCKSFDGCWIEPDGICQHGHKSWLLIAGII